MKKFLLSIFAVLFAFAGVQAEEVTKSVTFSDYTAGTQYAKNEKHDLGDGLVIYTTDCHFTSELRIYSSSTNNGYVVSDALPGTITKMTFNAGNKKDKLDIYGSNDGTTWKLVGQVDVTSTSYKDYSLNFTGSYTRFKIDVNGTNQVRLKKMSVTYTTAGEGGGETPDVPEVQAPTVPTLTPSCNFDNSMNVEITDIAEGATVYYTKDNSDPSANNGTEYTKPFEITATTTVKAIAVNEGGSSEVVSATYTKNEPVTPPAEGEVVDVLDHNWAGVTGQTYSTWSGKTSNSSAVYAGNTAGDKESIQLRSNNSNSGIVTTQSGGKAKKVVVVWNSSTADGRVLDVYGKNSAYTAATDLYNNSNQGTKLGSIKKGTSTELTIDGDYEYIGLRSNSGAMYLTSISITWDASAGVTVVPDAPEIPATSDFVTSMNFEITNFSAYKDGTTVYYSIDGGDAKEYTAPFPITTSCKIVAYAVNGGEKSAEATATYTRIAKDPVINIVGDTNADAFEGSIEVEIETKNDAVAYYTLNGEEPTIESTKYEGKLTIKATATLKVIAIEAGEYESGVTTKDFVMAVTGSDNIEGVSCTLSFADKAQRTEFSTSKQVWKQNGITLTNNKGSGNSVADYAAPARFYKNSEIIVEFTSPIAKIEFACNTLEYVTNLKNSIPGSTVSGNTVTVQLDGSSNSFKIGSLSGGQVRMDALTVTPVAEASASSFNLTIGNAGWATMFLDYAVAIPEGVTCYTVSEVGETSATLTELKGVIPANTGVIVNAEAIEYVFEPVDNESEKVGLMLGTTSNKYIFDSAYVLGVVDGEVGLYKAKMAGGVWLNNANKAYLPMPAGAEGIKSFSFRFEGEGTTAIENVEVENEVKAIYDLTGRRVEAITAPGIYIVNGKKVLVK